MNKSQALYQFWSSFGISAYDENSVPDDAQFPYISYHAETDSLGNVVPLYASIWDKNTSWERVSTIAEEVAKKVGEKGYCQIKLDKGYVWFVKGTPFAQRLGDPDKDIKRIYINLLAEFLTAY